MNSPLSLKELSPLFQILHNPSHPHFAAALEQITAIKPAQLNAADLPGFSAAIQTALAALQQEKASTETELARLRNQATALQSYGKHK
jgi:hypothetical protein